MMWINQILQGKEDHNQDDVFEIDQGPTRHLRKDSVQFTTNVEALSNCYRRCLSMRIRILMFVSISIS